MKTLPPALFAIVFLAGLVNAYGTVRYVNVNSTSPASPYTSWATAAATIQDAVNACVNGDQVLVTNGVYQTGGSSFGGMSNRVTIQKSIMVVSVNGPDMTIIRGYRMPGIPGTPGGADAVRCVSLGTGGTLAGFTLTNGGTLAGAPTPSPGRGGGIFCFANTVVSNCVLIGNSADQLGGGAYSGTFYNCAFIGNSAFSGGGAAMAVLNNCTVTANSAVLGGGTRDGTNRNSIVYHNEAIDGPNYNGGIFSYSCSTPLPSGAGNFANDPQLASASHLSSNSPCIGRGNASSPSGTDIDGELWPVPPSVGCDEYRALTATGALSAAISTEFTKVSAGYPSEFRALINGRTSYTVWDCGDGSTVTNQPFLVYQWSNPGIYTLTLRAFNESNPNGVSSAILVEVVNQPVHYVALGTPNPVSPYDSWNKAATNIQDAIDGSSVPGALVLVSNGVHVTGGRVVYGYFSNRVAITKSIVVRSLNGPAVTTISGSAGAIRCSYVANGALLSGFTLSNGSASGGGDLFREQCGGAIFAPTLRGVVSNCIISGNFVPYYGGGALGGTLNNCMLFSNVASLDGGGASFSTLNSCLVISNSVTGVYACTLNNSTVQGNSPLGLSQGSAYNSILINNSGGNYQGALNYCCTRPLPNGGSGNFTNDPGFINEAAGNFRLKADSPCVNAGNNIYSAQGGDLDGNQRITAGTADIGAYEFQSPGSTISHLWLQQYGLQIDGSTDHEDSDADGMNNWQEWRAGTVPIDSSSVLEMLVPSNSLTGLVVEWKSTTNRTYLLQRSGDLTLHPSFSILKSNLVGQSGTTRYTDTNANGLGPFFYRVGLQ